jgi:hypothetical protein
MQVFYSYQEDPMQYTRLGNTGLIVSRLAFGAMTFGSAKGTVFEGISKVDQDLANQLVAKALDAGINHFNTADVYTGGESEEFLGKALGGRRQDAVISTKVGFRSGPALIQQGLSRQHILSSAEGSLRRLKTDYIDVYLVHRLDPYTPVEETVSALDSLVQSGKVRSAFPIGMPGSPPGGSGFSASAAGRNSKPPNCITRSSGATWSTSWDRSSRIPALAYSFGVRSPAVS